MFVLLLRKNRAQQRKKMIWPFNKEEWARISNILHSSGSRFDTVGLGNNRHYDLGLVVTEFMDLAPRIRFIVPVVQRAQWVLAAKHKSQGSLLLTVFKKAIWFAGPLWGIHTLPASNQYKTGSWGITSEFKNNSNSALQGDTGRMLVEQHRWTWCQAMGRTGHWPHWTLKRIMYRQIGGTLLPDIYHRKT